MVKYAVFKHAIVTTLTLGYTVAALYAQTFGIDRRPEVKPFFDGVFPSEAPPVPTDLSTVVAFPALSFVNPLGLLPFPGTDRLVVWEREGRVWSFKNDSATSVKSPILNLSDRCLGWDDCGLLGLAFHPDFQANGYLYVWYNWLPPGTQKGKPTERPPHQRDHRQRLARFTWNATSQSFDNEYVLIDQTAHDTWHSGGGLLFHPENRFLYLANGDDEDLANNQRIDRGFFGCVIRIDVDKRGGNVSHAPKKRAWEEVGPNWPEAYYIPNDNPFVDTENALGEIYALGLRNPHRMTIDALTKRIFIGDVTEVPGGEVNVIEPRDRTGLNFQWNRIEGYRDDLSSPYHGFNKRPLLDYRGADGKAIIGGYVYRGPSIPELRGRYIFGDNFSNCIWAMDESTLTGSTPAAKTLLATLPQGPGPSSWRDNTGLSSFGVDAEGELYLCQMSSVAGQIYKLARNPSQRIASLPATLSATNFFTDLASLKPSGKLIPYDLNVPFWSDGAEKLRWVAIPTGSSVVFHETGEWEWPAGTVFVKHFEIPAGARRSLPNRRIETRVLVKTASGGVYGMTYKWRADQSDADLLDSGFSEILPTDSSHHLDGDSSGGSTSASEGQTWAYPSRIDCMSCHNEAAGGVLGPKTRQLNKSFLYPNGVKDNQLRAWAHAGLLDILPAAIDLTKFDALVTLGQEEESLEKRARSYLDVNCSYCHRSEGVRTFWDARFGVPPAQQRILQGYLSNGLGDPTARVIVPGDLKRSMIHRRMSETDPLIQMPPLGRNKIDQAAVEILEKWIKSLPLIDPLSVRLDAPATVLRGEPVRLGASVTNSSNGLRVEFFSGSDLIGESAAPPYELIWTGAMIGTHSLVAVVTDETGNSGVSDIKPLKVEALVSPPPPAGFDTKKITIVVILHIMAALVGLLVFSKRRA